MQRWGSKPSKLQMRRKASKFQKNDGFLKLFGSFLVSDPILVNQTTKLSSQFLFLVFGHFWQQRYENTKILHNLYLRFARQDGQDRKPGKKITQLKWPKYQNPKDENMVWISTIVNETLIWPNLILNIQSWRVEENSTSWKFRPTMTFLAGL